MEELVLAKGREKLKSLVEKGSMSQAEADAEYEQVMARLRTGGLNHALALGTHLPATMDTNADARERAALNNWCTCGARYIERKYFLWEKKNQMLSIQ